MLEGNDFLDDKILVAAKVSKSTRELIKAIENER